MGRPKRSSRRHKRIQRKNWIGVALITGVFVMMGGAFYLYQTVGRSAVDPDTGCPKDGAVALTVVMVDGSDTIAPRQQAFLRNQLETIKSEIPIGGALQVYRLGTDPESLLDPRVSVCNPGRGSDINPLFKSPLRAEKLWREAFQSKLQGVFDDLLDPDEEDWSPIFESIQSIGITTFASPEWQDKPKRLVLVSDMLQFTPEFSHYKGPGEFESFRMTEYYSRVRTNLSGVEVTVFYVPRSTNRDIQGKDHLDFWKDYFLDQGARPGRRAFFVHVQG